MIIFNSLLTALHENGIFKAGGALAKNWFDAKTKPP
jgi:hypothetical protein